MRYIEYVYLIIAVGVAGFIAVHYKDLTTTNVVAMSLGAGISAFMYSFRRNQRIILERKEAEELDDLKRKSDDEH